MNKKIQATTFEVIIIGGGHAGIEAAWAAAHMGSKTALITLDLDKIGAMPCNPAIGGIGKGHLVFEISAMGGLMPKLCTQTYLQARMLNTRKGPAVQGLRLQIDKHAYSSLSQKMLLDVANLELISGRVDDIKLNKDGSVNSILLHDGTQLHTTSLVITTGTFLNGKIHIGNHTYEGGRRGEQAVTGLATFFKNSGLKLGRLKTGTPPRLLSNSLDFSKMEYQAPDELNFLFEFYPHNVKSTHACYITHTNELTHEIIRNNLGRSATYGGNVESTGPRYCPSIEDKVARFGDKSSHHVFVEPEDATMKEVYPSGISTSLPPDVQDQYIRSIKGFENAVISKLGYAIAYDFVQPNQLTSTLEVTSIPGLFLAGQINGTTGYEEAGAQGLLAGINAHLKAHKQEPFTLDRTQSYIGVMVDDLVHMGVDEPYRMFTSRAERRLILRQDNAFLRLTDRAYTLGLINETVYKDFCIEKEAIEQTMHWLKQTYSQQELIQLFTTEAYKKDIIAREASTKLNDRALLTVHASFMYEPYLKREQQEIAQREQYKEVSIPDTLHIENLPGLSKELQEKMLKCKPATIADAALIPGMTPAAISLLIFKIREITKKSRNKRILRR